MRALLLVFALTGCSFAAEVPESPEAVAASATPADHYAALLLEALQQEDFEVLAAEMNPEVHDIGRRSFDDLQDSLSDVDLAAAKVVSVEVHEGLAVRMVDVVLDTPQRTVTTGFSYIDMGQPQLMGVNAWSK